jgi:hypothetical protein
MANIESNTLLEKLTQINSIKNRLRQSIIDIGGGDYITEQSPFAAFPKALSSTYSDIKNTARLLEYIINGGDLNDIATKASLTYIDILPYITSIQNSKQTLVDNLRIQGVSATLDETLDSLVDKVLKIETKSDNDNDDNIIYETIVYCNDYVFKLVIKDEGVDSYSNQYKLSKNFTNLGNTNIPGVIIKEIEETGDTESYGLAYDLVPNIESSYTRYFTTEEYFTQYIEKYSKSTIILADSLDNCDTRDYLLDGKKIGYEGISKEVKMSYSEKLGITINSGRFILDEDTEEYEVPKGFATVYINTASERFNIQDLYYINSTISYFDWNWSCYSEKIGDTVQPFIATYEDLNNTDWSYESIYKLYLDFINDTNEE